MPAKGFTCITLKKDEYKKIKALADAMGVSIRVLVNMAINSYVTTRYSLAPKLQLLHIEVRHTIKQLKLLRNELLRIKADENLKEYLTCRIDEVDNIIKELRDLEKELEELEKQVQQ